MKLHRRTVWCDGRAFTVITLRPDTDCLVWDRGTEIRRRALQPVDPALP
jgi:hypothetical protein